MATPNAITIGNLTNVVDLRGQLPGTEHYETRPLSHLGPGGPLKWLAVHHTGVQRDNSAREIASYHANILGWPGIGYHFLVHIGGRIDYVGDILTIRYNVARQNHHVIGICLAGDFTRQSPGLPQLEAARLLLSNLQYALGWPVPIAGHGEVALPGFGTACPGNTFLLGSRWKDRIVTQRSLESLSFEPQA